VDSTVTIANYGSYVGQSNYAAGSNVVQWARMRANPPNRVMPSTSFGTLTLSTAGNVIFSVTFTDQDPQKRGVTLWPDSSLTTVTTVTGTSSQSSVVSYYIVDGFATNINGFPTGVIAYNSTKPFLHLAYLTPATVYFGASVSKGSSMNLVSTQTNPLQMFFTLSGQYDDKTLYAQTVPFPAGMGTKALVTLSAYSGGTGAVITVSGNTFASSIKSFVGWIDSTGVVTVLTKFTTSSTGGVSSVTLTVPSATAGYYTIIVSDYTNSAYVVFQHT